MEATEMLEEIQELISECIHCLHHVEHRGNEEDSYDNEYQSNAVARSVTNVLNSVRKKGEPGLNLKISKASHGIHTKAEKFLEEEMSYFQDMRRRNRDSRKSTF